MDQTAKPAGYTDAAGRQGAITLAARPEPIAFDAAATALIVVDMQNDFAAAGGMFDRAGIPVNAIQAIVDPTREVLRASRAAGILVVYLKMQFAADPVGRWPVRRPQLSQACATRPWRGDGLKRSEAPDHGRLDLVLQALPRGR